MDVERVGQIKEGKQMGDEVGNGVENDVCQCNVMQDSQD